MRTAARHSRAPRRALAVCFLLALAWVALPSHAVAQGDSRASSSHGNLGLDAIGAVAASAGWANIENGFHAWQVGASVDFGYLESRRVRLVADVTYMLTLPKTEFVASEGATYRDVFRDLSGHLSLVAHATAPTARLAPYVAAGVGVHVLSSSFGSTTIDTRYNTNNFGLRAALGTRIGVGAGGRRALQLEVETLQARNVRRVAVTVGVAALYNDLVRR